MTIYGQSMDHMLIPCEKMWRRMKLGRTFPGGISFKSEASPERGDAAIASGKIKK